MTKQGASTVVPRLRFPEFRQAAGWAQTPLSKAFLRITNGKANSQDHEEGGIYPLFDRSAVIKASSNFMFSAEAVILPGEGMAFQSRYFEGKFNLHQRAYALMDCQGHTKYFYYALDHAKDDLALKAVKSTVLSLRLPIIEKFVVYAPEKREQQKIADCLTSLDEVIAAQGRKVEALKAHKRGLMQQLFPREGETRPHLRFPEFRNAAEWEEKEIGEVFRVTRGEVLAMPLVKGERSRETPYPVYSSQTKNQGLAGYFSDFLYGDAITWTTDGANAGEVNYREGKFYCTNVCGVLLSNEGYANRCVAALLNTVARNHVSYVGNPKLMNGVMAKIRIPFPSLKEQRRIANCLSSLDAQIAAESNQLAALKTHKQGLMQQLFPISEQNS